MIDVAVYLCILMVACLVATVALVLFDCGRWILSFAWITLFLASLCLCLCEFILAGV